jgi:hypothetical protein
MGRMKDLIYQGRFAVVNVGNDRYVSDLHNSIVARALCLKPDFGRKSTPKRRDFLVKPVLSGWFAEI